MEKEPNKIDRIKNPKKWVKGQSGNPKGRPKKLLNGIVSALKSEGYEQVARSEIVEVIALLLNADEATVKKMVNDKKSPMIAQILAATISKSSNDLNALKFILETAHGKTPTDAEKDTFVFNTNVNTSNFLNNGAKDNPEATAFHE